ncbi:MAG: 4Fe-4S dicluster domain-containing protein, partial [Thermodesulfobacteriota bacterium]|nr:4Fe-4S dicluster domain-containing protein [Thermodesulfobacteriota bacterium]
MEINRRKFLKLAGTGLAGAASGSILTPHKLKAGEIAETKEFVSVLVDTTRCIGCRSCEVACAEANNLPIPDIDDESVFEKERKTSVTQLTVVNRYETEKGEVFAKKQCMHCNQPGCTAACLVKAMKKREEGPVTWSSNCMGCRLCMVSCPFDIPKFEYHSAVPKILKCTLCWERLQQGEQPACVEACPMEALTFGTRREMIDEANSRIYQEPEKYVHQIYGEYEVGGTGYLYLSSVPFDQIGFKTDLGTIAYPKFSTGFLYSVPIVLLLWPAFLMGVSTL